MLLANSYLLIFTTAMCTLAGFGLLFVTAAAISSIKEDRKNKRKFREDSNNEYGNKLADWYNKKDTTNKVDKHIASALESIVLYNRPGDFDRVGLELGNIVACLACLEDRINAFEKDEELVNDIREAMGELHAELAELRDARYQSG